MSGGTDAPAFEEVQAVELENILEGVDTAEEPAGPENDSGLEPEPEGGPRGQDMLETEAEARERLEALQLTARDYTECEDDPDPEPPIQFSPPPIPEPPHLTAEEHFAAAQAEIMKRRAAGPTLATLALDGRQLTRLRLLVDAHISATVERHGEKGEGVAAIRQIGWMVEMHDAIEEALKDIPRDEIPAPQDPMPRQQNGGQR